MSCVVKGLCVCSITQLFVDWQKRRQKKQKPTQKSDSLHFSHFLVSPSKSVSSIMILSAIYILRGHSCNIGNAPSLVGEKLKTVICVFWMYIWYGITLTKMGKEMGKLKKNFNTYIWQNVWFFRPEEILTISCKIRCQSFNFICQALEQSLKFANRSYRLKEYICFQVFLKITVFLANM